jgi:hypothetical protein
MSILPTIQPQFEVVLPSSSGSPNASAAADVRRYLNREP